MGQVLVGGVSVSAPTGQQSWLPHSQGPASSLRRCPQSLRTAATQCVKKGSRQTVRIPHYTVDSELSLSGRSLDRGQTHLPREPLRTGDGGCLQGRPRGLPVLLPALPSCHGDASNQKSDTGQSLLLGSPTRHGDRHHRETSETSRADGATSARCRVGSLQLSPGRITSLEGRGGGGSITSASAALK